MNDDGGLGSKVKEVVILEQRTARIHTVPQLLPK